MPSRLGKRSDAELLALTPRQIEAFGAFYDRHVDAIAAYLTRRTGDPETALDLTSEVFAAALEGCRRYDPVQGPARAWLFGIANNKLGRLWSRSKADQAARRRMHMRAMDFSEEELQRAMDRLDASRSGYLQGLEHLSEAERLAVQAHVIDDRDYADIAAAESLSEAAIRKRVSRGLAKLARRGRDRS